MEDEKQLTVQELAVGAELGNIYYQYNDKDDSYTTYRIMRIQNKDTVSCIIDNDSKNVKKFKLEELRRNYSLLVSNAVLCISKVVVAQTPQGKPVYDIVILVYKKNSMNEEFTIPDIICRQAISDIFYEPFCKTEENPMVGLSVTADTIPANYSMKDLTVCDEVLESLIINTYRTDTLDTILTLTNHERWDVTLLSLLEDKYKSDKRINPFLPDKVPDVREGYCKDLRLLLSTTNFMYDFYVMLGITPVTFDINFVDDGNGMSNLPEEQKTIIQDMYQINMEKVAAIPFDFTVDLEEIKVPYVLIMDAGNTLYLIMYTRSKDEYVKIYTTTVSDDIDAVHKKLSESVAFYNKYSK